VDARAVIPIAQARWRETVTVRGRVRSVRIQPSTSTASLEVVLVDETGGVLIVFLGRRSVGGIELGREMLVHGTVGEHRSYFAILNPLYELL
jgi:RecG-like helicase